MEKLKINLSQDIALFKKTLFFIWESSRTLTIIRLSLIVLQAILPLIPLYLIKLIIDGIADLDDTSISEIWWVIVIYGIIQLIIILLNNLATYVTKVQGDKVSDYMTGKMLSKSIDLDLSHYDSDRFHDTYHRAQLQASNRPVALLTAITQLLQQSFMLMAIAGLLTTLHWAIGLVLFVMVIPIAIVQFRYTKKIFLWHEQTTPLERKAQYLKIILSTFPFAKEVRQFTYGHKLKQRFSKIRSELLKEKKQLYIKQNTSLSLVQGIEAIATVGMLLFIVTRALSGFITLGDIVMYFQAFQKGQSSVHGLLKSGVSFYENRLFLKHIFEFFDLESFISDKSNSIEFSGDIHKIEFRDVSFVYPGMSSKVLSKINLSITKGKLIALVGENGSGKSTLVKLLLRLYDPSDGQILLNDRDLRDYNIVDVRNKMTAIFQDFSKYEFSAEENIIISDLDREPVFEEVLDASKKSKAHSFIDKMDNGYNQQLGKRFYRGEELSGGQWQKMALARAFYKNSDVVILDEPTSQIDPLSEAEIFDEFRGISADRICILVTHRIYNLKLSDEIFVLDKGQIIETGLHNDLIKANGKYADMFKVQQ